MKRDRRRGAVVARVAVVVTAWRDGRDDGDVRVDRLERVVGLRQDSCVRRAGEPLALRPELRLEETRLVELVPDHERRDLRELVRQQGEECGELLGRERRARQRRRLLLRDGEDDRDVVIDGLLDGAVQCTAARDLSGTGRAPQNGEPVLGQPDVVHQPEEASRRRRASRQGECRPRPRWERPQPRLRGRARRQHTGSSSRDGARAGHSSECGAQPQ